MIRRHVKLFIITASVLFLTILIYMGVYESKVTGVLSVGTAYGNILYIEEYDLTLIGTDKDGVTYFCLPSYARLTDIDMTGSAFQIYISDEQPLSDPMLGIVQDITVRMDSGESVPWKICFMRSENLHSVFLDLGAGDIKDVSHDIYSPISVKVVSPSGRTIHDDDSALLKGRGNATWDLGEGLSPDKKPYEIRFSSKLSLGSIPLTDKWALLANAYEGTGILNKMVLDTAKKMGMRYVTNSEWIDLYADGKYLGNYLVCQEPQESAAFVADSGGFLIEKNDVYFNKKKYGFRTEHGSFTIKAPDHLPEDVLKSIDDYVRSIDISIHDETSLPDSIDMESFIRWYILEEFFFNDDALVSSCFFYTGRDLDTLYAGPPWDFDGTCGDDYGRYVNYDESILDTPKDRTPLDWYASLYEKSAYRERLVVVFNECLPIFEKLVGSGIDEYYDTVSASMEMDRAIYGRAGYGPAYTVPGYYENLLNNFRYTRFFLQNRLIHLTDIWGGSIDPTGLNDDSTHELIFEYPDDRIEKIYVSDGTQLQEADLPPYDEDESEGWVYEANGLYPSYYIPIYEDTIFILKH